MTYRERREARADRLRGWADKREQKADAGFARADELASAIPMGQPILVGHYSEGRDRRYRARIDATGFRALEDSRKAELMRSRADNIETAAARAIYSDDPDAVEALAAKIERLEGERARIKAYNASCRKGAPDLTLLDESLRRYVGVHGSKGGNIPAYKLSNLSGTINTARKRLEGLR